MGYDSRRESGEGKRRSQGLVLNKRIVRKSRGEVLGFFVIYSHWCCDADRVNHEKVLTIYKRCLSRTPDFDTVKQHHWCCDCRQFRISNVGSLDRKYDVLLTNIAANIKRLRKDKGLSQREMEAFGFDLRNYQRLESGSHSPSLYTLYKLGEAFCVDLHEFFK